MPLQPQKNKKPNPGKVGLGLALSGCCAPPLVIQTDYRSSQRGITPTLL